MNLVALVKHITQLQKKAAEIQVEIDAAVAAAGNQIKMLGSRPEHLPVPLAIAAKTGKKKPGRKKGFKMTEEHKAAMKAGRAKAKAAKAGEKLVTA